jgi:hypothetical protein
LARGNITAQGFRPDTGRRHPLGGEPIPAVPDPIDPKGWEDRKLGAI